VSLLAPGDSCAFTITAKAAPLREGRNGMEGCDSVRHFAA